jgi:hypothetical protein
MKVFADLSALFKIALICLVIGFILGICAMRTSWWPEAASVPVAPPMPGVPTR